MAKSPSRDDVPTVPFEAFELPSDSSGYRVWLAVMTSEGTRAFSLGSGDAVLGRSAKADVVVVGDDISREHAVLHIGSDGVTLRDCGSVNGTFVKGTRIGDGAPVPLGAGEAFRLGGSALCVITDLDLSRFPSEPTDDGTNTEDTSFIDNLVAKVAPTNLSVVLQGETGVGKDVMTRRIHALSLRAEHPLISINCAAIPENLLESELFGYVRGAFSGANRDKTGLFKAADRGTIFLDEISELPLPLQAKLLRALEDREIRPVGSTQSLTIDVRVVSASHRDLQQAVAQGIFRRDLFFRLNGITIRIPPLRERPERIPGLAREFAERSFNTLGLTQEPVIAPAAMEALISCRWPGNVRELRNVIERAIVLSGGDEVRPEHIMLDAEPPVMTMDCTERTSPPKALGRGLRDALQETERARIEAVLKECGYNQSRAAKILGIARNTLRKRMAAYGIKVPRTPGAPD